MKSEAIVRCPWCGDDSLYQRYHDEEWGRPLADPSALFELLNLEGAQAGLSWITVLRKRENYRRAFRGFDPERVARFNDKDVARLLQDPGIIRNRAKIEATVGNARAFLELQAAEGFVPFLWSFVDGVPQQNCWTDHEQIPATTPRSEAMSKALKQRGFRFVGPTICYSLMQASGMVNDHLLDCHCYEICRSLADVWQPPV